MKLTHILGNTYYIETKASIIPLYRLNGPEMIMLDSGTRGEDQNAILKFLEESALTVKAIICTHSHIDHIGNNIPLVKKYNALVAMHEMEAIICESIYNSRLFFIRNSVGFTEKYYGTMISPTHIKIKHGDTTITLFDKTFTIIPLYGHSPYHIGIVTPDGVCYLGDALADERPIRQNKIFFIQDIAMYLKTHQLLYGLAYEKYVLAHKGIWDDVQEIAKANEGFVYKKIDDILHLLRNPLTLEALVQQFITNSNIDAKGDVFKLYRIERIIRPYVDYLLDTEQIKCFLENNTFQYQKIL